MKNYYAFISYSRRDIGVALYLQRRIEKYVYPHEMVDKENRPMHDKFVRPLFLDITDLTVLHRTFNDNIKEAIAASRYLIVICSKHAAASPYVKEEIEAFLATHDNKTELILPVYVNQVFTGMPKVIDGILAERNCPIFIKGKGAAGHIGRKYAYYHILEFLLKADFDKLLNRYEDYQRIKRFKRNTFFSFVLAILIATLSYGWYNQIKQTQYATDLAQFEKETFPYSLVVGYIDNFLAPTIHALSDSLQPAIPHIVVMMPNSYRHLDEETRKEHFRQVIEEMRVRYGFEGFEPKEINIPGRRRKSAIVQMNFSKIYTPVFHDFATTVKAIRSVVDYKFDASRHRIKLDTTKVSRDEMVRDYSIKFIEQAKRELKEDSVKVHFVSSHEELLQALSLIQKENDTKRGKIVQ